MAELHLGTQLGYIKFCYILCKSVLKVSLLTTQYILNVITAICISSLDSVILLQKDVNVIFKIPLHMCVDIPSVS